MPSKPTKNTRLVLAERPTRGPVTPSTFRREQVSLGELADGDVLVRVEYSAIVRVVSLVVDLPEPRKPRGSTLAADQEDRG